MRLHDYDFKCLHIYSVHLLKKLYSSKNEVFKKVGFKHESNLLIFLYPISKVIYLFSYKSGYNALFEDL